MIVTATIVSHPTVHVEMDVSIEEAVELEMWMSEHTGPGAPNIYKELLCQLRKAIHERPRT